MVTLIVIGVIIILALILIGTAIRTVRPTERGLIERFGKYTRFAGPGLNFLIPFGIETMILVNITENMVNSEKREMITLDSLNCEIEAQVYFKVKPDEGSIKAAVYGVNNYQLQIVALAKTTLRNIIGTMNLKDANSNRSKINGDLFTELSKETGTWGIEIVRTELKEVTPPKEVQEVMNRVVVASNEKTAAIDFATAAENKADGEKRAAIKKAEGEKQARIVIAEGEAMAIKLVNEAANTYFQGNAVTLKQLETVAQALSNNAKIVLPQGQSLVNVIGSLAGVEEKKK